MKVKKGLLLTTTLVVEGLDDTASFLCASSGASFRQVVNRTSGISSSIISTCPSGEYIHFDYALLRLLGVLGHGVECTAILEPLNLTLIECVR